MAIVLQFLHNTLYDRCHCHSTKALIPLLDVLTVQFHTCSISFSLRKDSISSTIPLDITTELAEPAWKFKDSLEH